MIWVEFGGKPPPASVLARFAGQESISREEFQQAWAEGDLPAQVVSQVGMLVNQWQTAVLIDPRSTHAVGNDDDSGSVQKAAETSAFVHVVAQMVARAVAVTAVAPADRVKIMTQALGPKAWHDVRSQRHHLLRLPMHFHGVNCCSFSQGSVTVRTGGSVIEGCTLLSGRRGSMGYGVETSARWLG